MKKNLILILIIVLLGILLAYNAFDNKDKQTIEKEKTSEELISKDSNLQSNNDKEIGNEINKGSESEKVSMNNIDVVIGDENFISDMDNIFVNLDNYVGKTMKVEGFVGGVIGNKFKVLRLYDMTHDDHSHEVTVGINVVYDGEIPAEDTWVEVTGVITKEVIDGKSQPVIKVQRLEKKFTHGQKKVYN